MKIYSIFMRLMLHIYCGRICGGMGNAAMNHQKGGTVMVRGAVLAQG